MGPAEAPAPVPESEIWCGLAEPLSVRTSVAEIVPAAEGVNTTVTLQEADGARVVPQVLWEVE